MQKAPDLLAAVELDTFFFKASYQKHLRIKFSG
jgi:hypothetical protein